MPGKSDNLNSGHRARVRQRFIQEGNLDSFKEYEVLELMLFYAYPMRDTKAIAKRLLEKYHSLHNLLNARPEDLMNNGGLTENVAVYLSMMPYIARRYLSSFYSKGIVLRSHSTAISYLNALLQGQNYESVYLLSLDINKRLIAADRISSGSEDSINFTVEVVLERALLHKAKFTILAHNHPSGNNEPSEADNKATEELRVKFESLGIKMIDHIIICGDKNFSYARNRRKGFRERYY